MNRILKALLVIVVTAGAFLIAREMTSEFFSDEITEAELAAALASAATEINAQAPIQLDEITTLVSADASGTNLTYTNKVSVSAEALGSDFEEARREDLKDFVCGNKDMMITIDHGGSFTYKYIGNNEELIASIDITKRDCGG